MSTLTEDRVREVLGPITDIYYCVDVLDDGVFLSFMNSSVWFEIARGVVQIKIGNNDPLTYLFGDFRAKLDEKKSAVGWWGGHIQPIGALFDLILTSSATAPPEDDFNFTDEQESEPTKPEPTLEQQVAELIGKHGVLAKDLSVNKEFVIVTFHHGELSIFHDHIEYDGNDGDKENSPISTFCATEYHSRDIGLFVIAVSEILKQYQTPPETVEELKARIQELDLASYHLSDLLTFQKGRADSLENRFGEYIRSSNKSESELQKDRNHWKAESDRLCREKQALEEQWGS